MARNQAYLAALPPTETRLLAMLYANVAYFWGSSAKMTLAFEAATQAVEHARACGEPHVLARALGMRARHAINLSRLDGVDADLSEAEALPNVSPRTHRALLELRAQLAADRGDLNAALKTYEDLRTQSRSLGDATNEANFSIMLAEIEHERGNTQRAIAIVHEYLPAARAGADRNLFEVLALNLAGYHGAVDDAENTMAAAREAIASLVARDPNHAFVDASTEYLALAFALRGDLSRAATLEGYAEASFERQGRARGFTENTTYDRLNALLRDGLAPEELARLTTEGAALTREAALALALED
jgi:ATP/maltotriose-dependent transcriptional regulator MalT